MGEPSRKKRKKSEQQNGNSFAEKPIEKGRKNNGLNPVERENGQGDTTQQTPVPIRNSSQKFDTEGKPQKSKKSKSQKQIGPAVAQKNTTPIDLDGGGKSKRESSQKKDKVSDTDGSTPMFETPVGLDDSTILKKRRKKSKSISNGIKKNEDGKPASNFIERPGIDDTVKAHCASETLQQEHDKADLQSELLLRSDSQNQAASPITTDEPSEYELMSKNNGVSKIGTSKNKRKSNGFSQQDKENEDESDSGVENSREVSPKDIEDDCEVQNREANESQYPGLPADDNAKVNEEKQSENMEQKEKKKKKRASLPVLPWMRHPIEIDPDAKQPLEIMHSMHSCLRDALIKSETLYLLLSPSRRPF